MYYVYLIKSEKSTNQLYIGFTEDVNSRLLKHNSGQVPHTSKYTPWKLLTYIVFFNKKKALSFEKYLKSGSGRQFIYRHFLN